MWPIRTHLAASRPALLQTEPITLDRLVDFVAYDWGIVLPAVMVVLLVSKFNLVEPVVGVLYPDTGAPTRRVVARLVEVALWLSLPLVLSTRVDLRAVFGAGIGAVFVAYLIREPLKDSLSNFVAAAKITATDRRRPGVRIRLPEARRGGNRGHRHRRETRPARRR